MALEFDPSEVEMYFHDEDNLVARHRTLLLLVSRRPMKIAALKQLASVVGGRGPATDVERGGYITVIEASVDKPMTTALREQQSELLRQLLAPRKAWVATIVPTAWVFRGALQIMSLGASSSYRTFKKPRDAAEWLTTLVGIEADEIRGFIAWGRQLPIEEREL